MEKWEHRRLLILGKTYPNYSRKYLETACTGALLEPDMQMVRLYPIPFRYMDDSSQFSAWQYIEAKIAKDTSDPRPESYRVDPNSIELKEKIPPSEHDLRCRILEKSPHFFRSTEDLFDHYKIDRTSLGCIKPREIVETYVEPRSEEEREEWEAKEAELFAQKSFLVPERKKLDFPEAKFFVRWRCDDGRCTTPHRMSLHDWGIHELYRKLTAARDPNGQLKLNDKMREYLDLSARDVYLYLGNFRGTMFNFGLMAAYSAKKQRQGWMF